MTKTANRRLVAALKRMASPKIALPAEYDRLTPAQRREVREEYARVQDGKCCYCGTALDGPPAKAISSKRLDKRRFPKGFFENSNHLHHSHATGMTIGAVHAICNAVLWTYHGE